MNKTSDLNHRDGEGSEGKHDDNERGTERGGKERDRDRESGNHCDGSNEEVGDGSGNESDDGLNDENDDSLNDKSESEEEEEQDKTPYGFTSSTGWSEYKNHKSFLGMKVVTKQLYSITNGGKCSITLGSDTTLVGGSKLMIKGLAWSKHAHLGYHFSGSFATLSWSNDANDISIQSQKLAAENEKLETATFKGYIEDWDSKVASQESSMARITQLGQKVDLLESQFGQTGVELENTQFSTNTALLRKKILNTRIQNVIQDCQSVAQSTDQCANALEKVFFNVKTSASIDIEDKKLILM
ncbi:hypothetical protein [uncultured Shewanella sp.]|uniref:hypothetical protein n=1 Tax=uncultured Shewanella sp. TaxID=173975 RepID=UPI00261B2518|nr:hypothetical protein [uncultured Shewanella sp.]